MNGYDPIFDPYRHYEKAEREFAHKIRAEFLSLAIDVEDQLTSAIATHFFPDMNGSTGRYLQLKSVILGGSSSSFSRKITALQYILQQSYPALVEKYRQLFRLLDAVRRHRNLLAHGLFIPQFLKLEEGGTVNEIKLMWSRDGELVYESITAESAKQKLSEAEQASQILVQLRFELMEFNSPTTQSGTPSETKIESPKEPEEQ